MKNLKEEIKKAIERAQSNLAQDRKERDEAIANFQRRENEELEPINRLIQQYFDEELKDCNGCTIKENYVIINPEKKYPAYKVIKRGMQSFFGTPMFNPSVEVVTYHTEKGLGKKIKTLHKSELKEFQVLFEISDIDVKITINQNQ